MTATDPTLAGLLAGVLATPESDVPRLVLADYLDELSNHARAEFVRVQCELARLERKAVELFDDDTDWQNCTGLSDKWCPNCGDCVCRNPEESLNDKGCPLHDPNFPHGCLYELRQEQDALRRRERVLRDRYQGTWFAQAIGRLVYPANLDYEFRRGFIESVTCDLATFAGGPCDVCRYSDMPSRIVSAYGVDECARCSGTGRTPGIAPRLFASQPVTAVTLSDREPQEYQLAFGGTRVYGWCQTRPGESFNLPSELFALLECDDLNGAWKDYPTPAAALDSLSAALVAYGRANAEGMSHEAACGRCGGKGYWWRAGSAHGPRVCLDCHATGKVRHPGLPPLAGRATSSPSVS